MKCRKFIHKILGYCGHCKRYFKYPKKRRTSSSYNEDELNYTYECRECYERTEEYYQAMWDDYNGGRI